MEVNNCAIKKSLNISILSTRGRLVFGIPELLRNHFPGLKDVIVLYLIDELENFSVEQQRYILTLLRERSGPASLKIGARLYGIKTYSTFSGDEKIKEGSEYEKLPLDELLRANQEYGDFARRLVATRVANILLSSPDETEKVAGALPSMLQDYETGKFGSPQTQFVGQRQGKRKAILCKASQGAP